MPDQRRETDTTKQLAAVHANWEEAAPISGAIAEVDALMDMA